MAQAATEFETFVEAHRGPALRYATRVMGQEHDAEEVLQEALVRAWSAWDSVEDPDAREAWFFRVLRNACIDANRRAVNREVPSPEVAPAARPLVPEEVVLVRESLAEMVELLGRLSPAQRRTLLLREVGDLSYEEIARVTGAKKGTVMSRLFTARQRLLRAFAAGANAE